MILVLMHRVGLISMVIWLNITGICGFSFLRYNCSPRSVQVGASVDCTISQLPDENIYQNYEITVVIHSAGNFANFIALANLNRSTSYFMTINDTSYWTSSFVGRISYPSPLVMRFHRFSYGDHMIGLGMETRYYYVNSSGGPSTSRNNNVISVKDPIKAIQPLENSLLDTPVVIGENITLVCIFSAFPSVSSITWTDPSSRGIVSPNYDTLPAVPGPMKRRSEMRLHIVDINDGGNYACRGIGGGGYLYRNFQLRVKVKPIPKSPLLTPVAEIEQGHDLSLSCTFEGLPRVEIEWTDPSGRGENGVRYDLLQAGNLTSISTQSMTVRSIGLNEVGVYKCKATNAYGEAEQSVLVRTMVTPTVRSFSLSTTNDQSLRLVCDATAAPSTMFHYFINDLHVWTSDSNEFRLPTANCTLTKSNYSCEVSNSIGRSSRTYAEVEIEEIPNFYVTPVDYILNEAMSLTLRCYAKGCPVPNITWTKVGNSSFHASGGDLIFAGTHRNDSGTFICTATNSHGSVSTNAKITIDYPPVIVEVTGVNGVLQTCIGEHVNIQCSAHGHPVPAVGISRNGVMETESRIGGTAAYNFTVSLDSLGTIKCWASNAHGRDEKLIVIRSHDLASPPIGLIVLAENAHALVVTWHRPLCVPTNGIANYLIYVESRVSNVRSTYPTHACVTEKCRYEVKNLLPDVDYAISMAAVDNTGKVGNRSVEIHGTPTAKSSSGSDSSSIKWPYLAAICGLFLLLTIVGICCFCWKRKHNNLERTISILRHPPQVSGAPNQQSNGARDEMRNSNIQNHLGTGAIPRQRGPPPAVASRHDVAALRASHNQGFSDT